jgi:branched-chain amino acid transport system substrate-binding protein
MEVLREDRALKSVYLIGQDYSFGQAVLREAKRQLGAQRADIAIVGDELHPLGRIKDFAPYAAKIKASGAGAVMTGNFGNDLTLLIKACKEVGFDGKFYTFYGNALGAPAAIGEAGIGKVIAVADWLPNVGAPDGIVKGARQREADAFMQAFRKRFPKPEDDYVHMRMQLMMEALAQALQGTQSAQSIDVIAVAQRLAKSNISLFGQTGNMRATDHQFQQPLVVGLMDKQGNPGVKYDVEGSGYGFRVIRVIDAAKAQMPTSCKMSAMY